jgi:hypothetical protein
MDSIGGSSLCLMVACVSPGLGYYEETLNTLMYATRAKRITNRPQPQLDPEQKMICGMRHEIELLRNENQYLRSIVVCSFNARGDRILAALRMNYFCHTKELLCAFKWRLSLTSR